ncbi:MAG TPA: cytochrome P450 [Thermoleophilaceae bacterium]|nr:cytochrome P450 [Thermoleophilaceae bacterium]
MAVLRSHLALTVSSVERSAPFYEATRSSDSPPRAGSGPRPPGPRLPVALQALLLFRDPVGYLERCRRRYGPVFRIKFPGAPPLVYVTDPSLARELYGHDRDGNRAGEARKPYLSPLVGEHSVLCLEGEQWQRQRRLLAPPLHGQRVAEWRDEIAGIAKKEVDSWPAGEEIELRPRMQSITLEVILRVVFGIEDAGRLDRLRRLLPALLDAVDSPLVFGAPRVRERLERSPLLSRLPGNPVRRFEATRAATDELLYEEIARRRAETASRLEGRADLLSTLLLARDEQGNGMADEELRDELVTLLTAGHETTATALAWAFERLVRHPLVLERLLGELEEGRTEYLDAVVKEVLRARPVVFDTPRALSGPLSLGGYEVPAGWWAAPAIPLVHRSAELFDDPDTFDPERFLGEDPPVGGWIPFGGGQRRCLGSRLALLELQTVISAVLTRRTLTAPDPSPEKRRVQHVTLAPARRARVVTELRA